MEKNALQDREIAEHESEGYLVTARDDDGTVTLRRTVGHYLQETIVTANGNRHARRPRRLEQ